MIAREVPTHSCMRTSSGTPRSRNTSNSTGTTTAPPPTPNNPASRPVMTPAAITARASEISSASGTPAMKSTAAVAAERLGQLGDTPPVLAAIDGLLDIPHPLRMQNDSGEFAKLFVDLGFGKGLLKIAPVALARM